MAVAVPERRSVVVPGRKVARVLREVARRPAGRFGLFVIGALLVIVVFTPLISPYGPAAQHRTPRQIRARAEPVHLVQDPVLE